MNITLQTYALSSALGKCARALGGKAVMPALENVLIKATNGDELELTCSNGEIITTACCAAGVTEIGALCLPGKTLLEIVRKLLGTELSITTNERYEAVIKSGSFKTRLKYLEAHIFPELPTIANNAQSAEIQQPVLKRMIARTSHAIGEDEGRRVLTGAYLEVDKSNSLRITALDGYQLAHAVENGAGGSNGEMGVIIPRGAISEVYKLLSDDPDGRVDIIIASPPCQCASVAGKRLGDGDERNRWRECLRIVRDVGPRWCLFENVARATISPVWTALWRHTQDAGRNGV